MHYCSMYSFNIIATYLDGEQDVFDIELNILMLEMKNFFIDII